MGNKLIVASRNPDKLIELRRILEAGRVPVDVGDLSEFPDLPEIAETGLTFTENALIKARAVAAFTGLPAVADDSGLCADALNGMPGVTEGLLDGALTTAPRGTNGFGYDPIFVPEGAQLTTAEMSPADKDKISHRGRAFRALAPIIAALLGS